MIIRDEVQNTHALVSHRARAASFLLAVLQQLDEFTSEGGRLHLACELERSDVEFAFDLLLPLFERRRRRLLRTGRQNARPRRGRLRTLALVVVGLVARRRIHARHRKELRTGSAFDTAR